MPHSPIFSAEATKGRRRFLGFGVAASLVLLALAACSQMNAQPRDPGDRPFWERNEQRDD